MFFSRRLNLPENVNTTPVVGFISGVWNSVYSLGLVKKFSWVSKKVTERVFYRILDYINLIGISFISNVKNNSLIRRSLEYVE